MALPVPLPLFHWRRIRNLDKEKQTLAASLSERWRRREAEEDRENEAEKWTEERHEENEGQKERGRVGRQPERIFKEWHLPVAIHRFSFYHHHHHHPTPKPNTHVHMTPLHFCMLGPRRCSNRSRNNRTALLARRR